MKTWQKNLYILWTTQIISLISFGFGIPFIPFYIRELGVTAPAEVKLFTGILSMAPAVSMAIMAPVWGALSDRFGRKLMILRAMFTATIIITGMGLVSSVYALLILRLAQGFFTGTVTAAATFVAANTPKERLSYAIGFISSSTFIGYSIGPAVGGVIAKYAGYRSSFILGGVLMLVGAIIVLLFLKEDKNSYGKNLHDTNKVSIRQLLTPLVLLFLFMLFLQRFIRSLFGPYMPLFVELLNGTENAEVITGFVNLAVGLTTAFAAILVGRLGDKLNKSKIVIFLLAISVVVGFVLAQSKTLVYFAFFYTLLFFVIGGIEPLMVSYITELTPTEVRGRLFGLNGMVGSFGWMASPLVASYITIYYGYDTLLLTIPILLLLNFVVSLLINRFTGKTI